MRKRLATYSIKVHGLHTARMLEAAGVIEELKACDPMRWGLMNTLKAQAEEIIQSELIFQ